MSRLVWYDFVTAKLFDNLLHYTHHRWQFAKLLYNWINLNYFIIRLITQCAKLLNNRINYTKVTLITLITGDSVNNYFRIWLITGNIALATFLTGNMYSVYNLLFACYRDRITNFWGQLHFLFISKFLKQKTST